MPLHTTKPKAAVIPPGCDSSHDDTSPCPQHERPPVGDHPYRTRPLCGLYTVTDAYDDTSLEELTELVAHAEKTALPHMRSDVRIGVTHHTTRYTVTTTFRCGEDVLKRVSTGAAHLVMLFPFSECGAGADQLTVRLNNIPLFGQLIRATGTGMAQSVQDQKERNRNGDGSIGAPEHKQAASSAASPSSPTATPTAGHGKALYYYVASNIPYAFASPPSPTTRPSPVKSRAVTRSRSSSLSPASPGTPAAPPDGTVVVTVAWRCCEEHYRLRAERLTPSAASTKAEEAWRRAERKTVALSLYCVPQPPASIECDADFSGDTLVRIAQSPNGPIEVFRDPEAGDRKMHVSARLDGPPLRRTDDTSENGTPSSAPPTASPLADDYVYLLNFFFGEMPETEEETQTFAVVVIVVAVALFVWFLLTKDLVF